MTYVLSVTSQGQIGIPAKLRRKYGINTNSKVILSEELDKLTLEPVADFLSLKGSLKSDKKPLSNMELEEVVAEGVAEEYARKLK